MHNATVFERSTRQTMLKDILRKRDISNEMWTCK
jgi:hypothetical protein